MRLFIMVQVGSGGKAGQFIKSMANSEGKRLIFFLIFVPDCTNTPHMSSKTSPEEKSVKKTLTAPSPALKYWIDLGKWFLISVVIVIATKIVDTGFKERQTSLTELKFYDTYVTNLIVLNPSPVNKRFLAQYLICVTTSDKLRDRWQVYYDSIYPEYAAYVQGIESENKLLEERYNALKTTVERKDNLLAELARIEAQLAANREKLVPSFVLPEERQITPSSLRLP